MVSLGFLNNCDAKKNNHVQVDFDNNVDSNDNDGAGRGFSKEIDESFSKAPTYLKNNLGFKVHNELKSLEMGDVGVNLERNMLEFVDSMNQKIKCVK